MASGIINLTSNSSGQYGRISWSSTTNSSTLTSDLTVNFQISRSGSGGTFNSAAYMGSFKLNHSNSYVYIPIDSSVSLENNGAWVTVESGVTTISHASNGSAPAITVTGSFKGSPNGVTFTAPSSATIDLGIIPIAATITSAPNFNDTDNPTIGYSNPAGSNASSIKVCIANSSGSVIYAAYREVSKTGSSYTFNLTDAERTALRNAVGSTTLSVRFYIWTVINGTSYYRYSATKTMTLTDAAPTLNPTVVDTLAASVALTGNSSTFITNHNTAKFTFNATAKKGATIASYEVTNGSNRSTSSTGTFSNISSNTFVFTVRDSRGAVATKIVVVPMIDYIKPTCNQSVMMVAGEDTTAQIHLALSGNFFNGSFGAQSNSLSIYVRHTQNNGTMGAWSDLTPLLYEASGNTYTFTTDISGFDVSGSYVFQSKVVDKLGVEAVSEQYTVKFYPVFDWSKYDFNFNVPITIQGNPLNDFVIATGTESMGSNGTWYWEKWASGKAVCYGCRNYGNMAITTSWGSLYRSDEFTQALPSGLFNAFPSVTIDIAQTDGTYYAWVVQGGATSTTTSPAFHIIRPASTTLQAVYLGFHAIGRWK